MTDLDLEPHELTAVKRAKRRVRVSSEPSAAAAALRILVAANAPDDPPIFTGLDMPSWNEPSGIWPVVDEGPILGPLNEEVSYVA